MSAVFTLETTDAAFLFSDAAGFSPTGMVETLGRKIAVLPRAKAALVARGFVMIGRYPEWLFSLQALEAVVERLPELAVSLESAAAGWFARSGHSQGVAHVEVALVGWSDAENEAQTWAASTAPAGHDGLIQGLPGYEPGIPLRCAPAMGAPSAELPPRLLEALGSPQERDRLDARVTGIEVLKAMRTPLRELPSGVWAHTVGGGIEMAVANAQGVAIDCVHSWPDVLGAKIEVKLPAG